MKLINETQDRLNELNAMPAYRQSYLSVPQTTKITQVGLQLPNYATEAGPTNFSTDNQFNNGNAHRLEFVENRLIGYKLDINALYMEFVNRDTNDFLRRMVRNMPTFTNRVRAGTDLANRVFSFNNVGIAKNQVAGHITTVINNFRRPGLKDWVKAIDTEASGSHIIIISAGNYAGHPIHFTNHKANVNGAALLSHNNNQVVDILFPDTIGAFGTHTTYELFGKDDKRNPRYFKGYGLRMPSNASRGDGVPTFRDECLSKMHDEGITQMNVSAQLQTALTNTINNDIKPELTTFRNARLHQIL